MTPDEAADLAARTLAAIDAWERPWPGPVHRAADRERVASDLAGLHNHGTTGCRYCEAQPCSDADRYADGLRRTAALYGVT